MSRIFISYKRVDKDKVFKIKEQIESALGEKCWIDIDGIESDAQFMNVIIKAIRECEVLLFMYSKAHAQIPNFKEDWTIRELIFATKKKKRIVFVNIDGSPLSDEFEFMYGTQQQVDATSESALLKLCEDLESRLFPERVAERERKRKAAEEEAQRKLKEEEDERIRKEAEEKVRQEKEARAQKEQKNKNHAKVHLCVDADSRVYYQNKEIVRCSAHEEVIVDLPFGEHTLKIISVEDNSVKKQLSVNVNSSSLTVDEIKIAPIIKRKKTIARKQKEEEERKEELERLRKEETKKEAERKERERKIQLESLSMHTNEEVIKRHRLEYIREKENRNLRVMKGDNHLIKNICLNSVTKTILVKLKYPIKILAGIFSLWGLFTLYLLFCSAHESANDLMVSLSFTTCTVATILFATKSKVAFLKYISLLIYFGLFVYNFIRIDVWYIVQEDWEYIGYAFVVDMFIMSLYNLIFIIYPQEYEDEELKI